MTELADQLQALVNLFAANIPFLLSFLGLLWGITFVNKLLGYRLNIFGIYPRSIFGLIGIVCAPFLHGNFNHLFLNSIPLFVLGGLVLISGRAEFYSVTVIIVVLSGLALWLFGRRAIHVGASALIMGYLGFLLIQAFTEITIITFVIGFISIYYFGLLLLGIFPSTEKGISWEGHLFGLLAGLAALYLSPVMLRLWQ